MTDPMHSGFDSLLQDLGVPVEIHESSTDTAEPAEQVVASAVADVTESVVITTADAPPVSAEDAGAPRDDRKRRRRRRRRGPDQGNGNGQDSEGADSDREGDEEGETQMGERPSRTALIEASHDEGDEEEEEKFVLEDLTNLQFPAWDDLIGSLYKPGN